jgi:hypothetical protein
MGVTIHYRGRLKTTDLLDSLIAEVQDICDINSWKYTLFPDDFGKKPQNLPDVRGISFKIHEESEPVTLFFDSNGILRSFFDLLFRRELKPNRYSWVHTKTQFAGVDAHIKVINLLVHLKKQYFKKMEIDDEGGYLKTKDRDLLEARLGFINQAIDTIADVFKHGNFEDSKTPEEFVENVRHAISRSFRNVDVKVIRLDANNLSDAIKNQLKMGKDDEDDNIVGEGDWSDLEEDDDNE